MCPAGCFRDAESRTVGSHGRRRRHPPEKTCDTRQFGDAYRGAEGHRIVGALIYGCCSRIKLVSYSCTALSYRGRRHAPHLARDFFLGEVSLKLCTRLHLGGEHIKEPSDRIVT